MATKLSYEDRQEALERALEAQFGAGVLLVQTWDDRIIFKVCPQDGDVPDAMMAALHMSSVDTGDRYFQATYTVDTSGPLPQVTFAQPQEVVEDPASYTAVPADAGQAQLADSISLMYSVAGMPFKGGKAPPPNVQRLPAVKQRQWCEVWNSAYARAKKAGKADKDAEAAAFAQANGVVDVKAEDATEVTLADWYDQVDASHLVALRLADEGAAIPVWQQYHTVGKWSVPHGVAGKIQFTREMGDSIIRNFKANVLRRGVPLDERHQTEQNGIAHAWAEDFRWGHDGEGLPGAPEPSGSGPILFVKWSYLDTARELLSLHSNGRAPYEHFSPQYSLDYVDKQTGAHYGPTALAGAMTNDPFIRNIRSMQGRPPMPWVDPAEIAAHDVVILTDGLRPYVAPQLQEGTMSDTTTTEQTGAQETAEQRLERLERELAEQRAAFAASEQARQASDAQLADERRKAYQSGVDVYCDDQIRRGVPPASINKFRTLLKRLEANARPVISLADDPAATPTLTLADAVKECMAGIVPVNLTLHTRHVDVRPADQVALEEQVAEREKTAASDLVAQLYPDRVKQRNGASAH